VAYASITVKNPKPNDRDDSIALTSEIGFDLAPYDGARIDISTLEVFLIMQGGLTNRTMTRSFKYGESDAIRATGNATDGYVVRIDPYPKFSLNFESDQRLEFRVDVKDYSGTPMRKSILKYEAVRAPQYDALSDLIREVTEINSNYEQGRIGIDKQTVDFTYRNWSLVDERKPKIFKNDIELDDSLFTVKHNDGKVKFVDELRSDDAVDLINANYYYSALSETQMISFMKTALSEYNAYRPMTAFSLKNAPKAAEAIILLGGACLALHAVQAGFINQQYRVQFGEDKEWQNVKELVVSLRDSYKDQMQKMLEEKKYNLARPVSMVIPEFSLPGGRNRFFRYMYKGGDGGMGGV
jgi:hypothetical protein